MSQKKQRGLTVQFALQRVNRTSTPINSLLHIKYGTRAKVGIPYRVRTDWKVSRMIYDRSIVASALEECTNSRANEKILEPRTKILYKVRTLIELTIM